MTPGRFDAQRAAAFENYSYGSGLPCYRLASVVQNQTRVTDRVFASPFPHIVDRHPSGNTEFACYRPPEDENLAFPCAAVSCR